MAAWPKQKPHSLAGIVIFTLNEGDGSLWVLRGCEDDYLG